MLGEIKRTVRDSSDASGDPCLMLGLVDGGSVWWLTDEVQPPVCDDDECCSEVERAV